MMLSLSIIQNWDYQFPIGKEKKIQNGGKTI